MSDVPTYGKIAGDKVLLYPIYEPSGTELPPKLHSYYSTLKEAKIAAAYYGCEVKNAVSAIRHGSYHYFTAPVKVSTITVTTD